MSLREAYTLAHTAQCRLQLAASRPDRNLRFVVGHLMHYESLRLRIVEIEHEVTKPSRSSAVAFKGTGQAGKQSSGRKSPPPPPQEYDYDTDSDDEEDMAFDDEAEDGLSLERFPSASAQKPQPAPQPTRTEPPELEPDEGDYSDEDEEPRSPEDPSPEDLERAVKSEGNELYATYYEGVRKCVCHGNTDAPKLDRMWELPPDPSQPQTSRKGVTVTRAVAQVSDTGPEAQSVCTANTLNLPAAPPQQVVA